MNALTEARHWIFTARNVFLKEGGWRWARAFYLIGGFARGEGTCDLSDGRLRIYNDLDFLVVVKRKTPRRMLALHRILRTLNDGRFDCPVDLVVVAERQLADPPPLILHYDIQHSHEWLWGRSYFESAGPRRLAPDELSRADALQLLLNRQASLIIGLSLLASGSPDHAYLQVQLSKPLLAMMAAAQVEAGCYQVAARDQLRWMQTRVEAAGLLELLQTAVDFRHAPSPEHFQPFDQSAATVAGHYFEFLTAFMGRHYGAPTQELPSLITAMQDHQPKQWDLIAPSWWACRLRARGAGLRARRPGRGPHPLIDVYAAHLRWMERYVAGEVHLDADELKSMIQAWKISGYDCTLR